MKIKLNYNENILNVPGEAVVQNIGTMSGDELRVLLYICASPDFRADTESGKAHAIKSLDMQWAAIESAVASLGSRGIISTDVQIGQSGVESRAKKGKASVKADSPVYTKVETAGIISRNDDLHRIINDDVPRLTGKAVSQNEAMILVSLYDYLKLDARSIVKLIDFCRVNGAVSFRVVERTAYSLFDADITTPEEIDDFIARESRKNEITSQIRELFGIGKRALIASEKNLIKTWTETYGYDMEIINRAYEVTIRSINEPSLNYAGAVMKRWHEQGILTAEDAEKDMSAKPDEKKSRSKKAGKKTATEAESFNADDFMEAALKRSYGEID
ncbi:MAG: DnaD domain protein [Clostridia bacterium]|nr:DnaD domain protein [Clostridia bacterium]